VVSISQLSEDMQLLYDLVKDLTISTKCVKWVIFIGLTARFSAKWILTSCGLSSHKKQSQSQVNTGSLGGATCFQTPCRKFPSWSWAHTHTHTFAD
jgi:hypothetical protein